MKLNIETRSASVWKADVLAVPFMNGKLFSHISWDPLQKKISSYVQRLLEKEEFKGDFGEVRIFPTQGKLSFEYVMIVGLGSAQKLKLESFCKIGAILVQSANKLKCRSVVSLLALASPKEISIEKLGQSVAEGSSLGVYRFERYKSKQGEAASVKEVRWVLSNSKEAREFATGLKVGEIVSEGVGLARDLINIPAKDKPPVFMGRTAKTLRGIRTKIFDVGQIKRMGMGALYGVGQGSKNPPVLVEMHYKPKGRIKKRVAVVGKGIVFDSGGLSLKPPKSMETMKDDMSGAAAVLGLMKIMPRLKIPVEVYAYIACAENMPDGNAQRPGDIVRAYNGKTIEVLNTDAEGRLALADALSYVTKHRQVDYIIDIATLTGAALVALGDLYTAALGTDSELIQKLKNAGEECGEKIWELPLAEEYAEEIKSPVADLQNIGGPYAGTINGALFLRNFVSDQAKWVHLDIAGPSWANKPWTYAPKGGTGIMVRTLQRFLAQL